MNNAEKAAGKTATTATQERATTTTTTTNSATRHNERVTRGAMHEETASAYDESARAFLRATGARMSARYLGKLPAPWDTHGDRHAAYSVTISSANGEMRVRFYDSVRNTENGAETITAYAVLSGITKYAPGSFDDFCSEMGFFPIESQADYKRAMRTWRACGREYAGVCRVWPAESDRDGLTEIN